MLFNCVVRLLCIPYRILCIIVNIGPEFRHLQLLKNCLEADAHKRMLLVPKDLYSTSNSLHFQQLRGYFTMHPRITFDFAWEE